MADQNLKKSAEKLRSKGRGGDTILAHINPQEAAMLKMMGGSGTKNPDTGLPEFIGSAYAAKQRGLPNTENYVIRGDQVYMGPNGPQADVDAYRNIGYNVILDYAPALSDSGGFFGGLSNALASIDPSAAISKAATDVFQPAEKAVSAGVQELSNAYSAKDAQIAYAIAAAYFLPGVGSALGQTLVNQGLITGAATQYATAIGTALASTGASVAQGVPFDTALTNATVNAVTSTGSQSVAGYISKLGASPEVANAITSVGASGLATAAKGGSAADIETNMKGALAGSTVTGLTGDKLSGAVVGGGITGGTTGALLGAAGAAGAGKDVKKTGTDTTTSVSGVDPGVQVAGGDDASALNLASVSAKPEMLGKEGEKSSQISVSTDNEGITTYSRSITGTTLDGKPYGYVVKYDPGAPQGKQISYETGYVAGPEGNLVDPSGGAGITSTFKRPDFTATDATKTGGTVAGEGLVIASDKSTGGGSSVTPSDQAVLDLIKPTPTAGQATTPQVATGPVFTPAVAPGRGVETDEERIARINKQTTGVIGQEGDYTAGSRPAPKTTDQAVIDLTGLGGGNVGGNVVVGPGTGLGAGNATGNVVISDGGAGAGGGNATGNVVVGPGTGDGGGPGAGTGTGGPGTGTGVPGTGTGDGTGTGGGGDGTGPGAIVEVEPPADEDKKVVDEDKKDETVDDTYTPDIFIYGKTTPKTKTRTTTDLGTTLQAPFYPSSTLGQALTGYRGAGEIEGKKTGKPRKNVWNEESLRLKDALGL